MEDLGQNPVISSGFQCENRPKVCGSRTVTLNCKVLEIRVLP